MQQLMGKLCRLFPPQPHPLLWSAFPALSLLVVNLEQTHAQAVLRPLAASLAGVLILNLALRLILKDAGQAALAATLWVGVFFLYGHVYELVENLPLLGRHRYLLIVWGVLAAAGSIAVLRWGGRARQLHTFLNLTGGLLVIWMLGLTGWHAVRGWLIQQRAQPPEVVSASSLSLPVGAAPDVYTVILDGYTRQDVLETSYGFDNTPFLDQLRDMGFYVADCSQSNYAWTMLSLSSSLQMDYLESYNPNIQSEDAHPDYQLFHDYIAHSPVRRNLEALGYQTVAFETGWPFTEISDAGLYIEKSKNRLERYLGSGGLSAFENMLLRTTLLRPLVEVRAAWQARLPVPVRSLEQQHYERLVFVMSQAEKLPAIPGPKFVFLHLVAPHAPYILQSDGTFSDVGAEEIGYPEEIRYLNRWFVQFAQKLIDESKTPPVIILQGDHGWRQGSRLAILNAYYLPGGADGLYNSITPVNSFRVVFNQVFGGDYSLLEDRSYDSPEERQLDLKAAPLSCPVKE